MSASSTRVSISAVLSQNSTMVTAMQALLVLVRTVLVPPSFRGFSTIGTSSASSTTLCLFSVFVVLVPTSGKS